MIDHVLNALRDHYHELDDSGDSPFGEYAEVESYANNAIKISNPVTGNYVVVTVMDGRK